MTAFRSVSTVSLDIYEMDSYFEIQSLNGAHLSVSKFRCLNPEKERFLLDFTPINRGVQSYDVTRTKCIIVLRRFQTAKRTLSRLPV